MKLYHLTCEHHLSNIVRERRLRTTTSDLDMDGSGPAVVWLTTDGEPNQEWQHLDGKPEVAQKNRVRITVEVPDHEPQVWVKWALKHGAHPVWVAVMVSTGVNPGKSPDDWRVVTRPVPWREWLRIEKLNDQGEWSVLWDRADGPLRQLDGMLPNYRRAKQPKPEPPNLQVEVIRR